MTTGAVRTTTVLGSLARMPERDAIDVAEYGLPFHFTPLGKLPRELLSKIAGNLVPYCLTRPACVSRELNIVSSELLYRSIDLVYYFPWNSRNCDICFDSKVRFGRLHRILQAIPDIAQRIKHLATHWIIDLFH